MTVITNANLPVSNGSGDAALAHIQSNRVIGSTTIATDTISNWPANFIATTGTLLSSGFIDPTSKTDFYGHLGVGNQLIIDGFCPGNADNGNTSGQVVVIKPNTEWANLIANGVQSTSNFPFQFANFVEPAAGIWTIVSGLAGTQTVGNVWYQGVRYSIPAVASNTFTALKDTYVDVNPATGAYTYVPVANFAAEPALTASCVRVAKIITGASGITGIYQMAYNTPRTMLNSSNSCKFSVNTSAATSIPNNTQVKIPFNIKIFDTSNNFDNTTNFQFYAPVAGFYQFNVNAPLYGVPAAAILTLYKNGASFRQLNRTGNANAGTGAGSALVQLAAGDIIYVNAFQNGGSTMTMDAGAYFDGFLESAT